MTPADDLRAAVTVLRETLPGDLVATPRLVMTDAETLSGIAFCVDHLLPCDVEHEFAACDHCEVIDCLHERLAALVLALLLAREPLADWLEEEARQYDLPPCDGAPGVCNRCGWDPTVLVALAAAQVIRGGTP